MDLDSESGWESRDGDEFDGEFFPSRQVEDVAMDFLDEFEEDSFWESLSIRLARRDMTRQLGEVAFERMRLEERLPKLDKLAGVYYNGFEKNGLDSVVVGGWPRRTRARPADDRPRFSPSTDLSKRWVGSG